jgi:hypothetical protein
VQPLQGEPPGVAAVQRRVRIFLVLVGVVAEIHGEFVRCGVLIHQKDRVDGLVDASGDGIEVGQWSVPAHRLA